MQAVVLAGGKGTRLNPYTTIFPKPLVPIGNMPILEIIIRQLAYFKFTDIILAVGHLNELIMAYFGDGSKWNLRITYSIEDEPLGTAGPVKLASDLEEDFLVLNGDILCDLNFLDLYNFHKQQGSDVTLSVFKKTIKIDLGVLTTENGNIKNYIEKPEYSFNVSMGVYVFKKEVLNLIPEKTKYDLPQLVQKLLYTKATVVPYFFDGYWLDIGRPDDYETAAAHFNDLKSKFLK
jgi:NDP-mannose synthase